MSYNGCTCNLDGDFFYDENDSESFDIMDAECVQVAWCRERRYAELIVAVLNSKFDERNGEYCLQHRVGTKMWNR